LFSEPELAMSDACAPSWYDVAVAVGERGVELALRLSRVLGRSAESWLAMQDSHDLWQALQRLDLSGLTLMALSPPQPNQSPGEASRSLASGVLLKNLSDLTSDLWKELVSHPDLLQIDLIVGMNQNFSARSKTPRMASSAWRSLWSIRG